MQHAKASPQFYRVPNCQIPTVFYDTVIMNQTVQKTCQLSGERFEITSQEQDLLKKMQLPLPLFSPKIREVMRLAFRNERNLFLRKCDATKETMISIYRADAPFPVYKYDYWISDKWTPPELDYDFDQPFFEQYAELSLVTPRVNGFSPYNENCEYVNAAEKNKNCYMHILSDRSEDCYYTHGIFACRDCIDCAHLHDCELCYEATDCRNCYHCRMSFLCDNSSELNFCFDMRGCQNCFFCHGLRNQQYCFFNQQLSREEYEEKIKAIDLGSYKIFKEYKRRFFDEIMSRAKYIRLINNENSDGNFLINTKNCHHCYDVENAQDCCYLRIGANGLRDVHHSHAIVDGSELIYGNVSTTEAYNCHNVIGCWTTKDSAYGEFLQGCQNCIGCISLRYKKNCILNKQYSPEEFQRIKKHIMEELGEYWGSPLPLKLAPFDYQDSAYRDYSALSPDEVEKMGWRYGNEQIGQSSGSLSTDEISDNIKDFDGKNIGKAYRCVVSGRPFKIIEQEYRLLKKIIAPLPRRHFEIRFQERVVPRKAGQQ